MCSARWSMSNAQGSKETCLRFAASRSLHIALCSIRKQGDAPRCEQTARHTPCIMILSVRKQGRVPRATRIVSRSLQTSLCSVRKQGDVPPLRCVTLLANITLFYKEARTRATRCAHCVTVLAFVIITQGGSMDTCHALRALCHDPCIADQRCKVARTRAARFAHCVTVLAFIIIVLWAGSRNASDNEHCHIGH